MFVNYTCFFFSKVWFLIFFWCPKLVTSESGIKKWLKKARKATLKTYKLSSILTTGGPQIALFLRPQVTVLLRKLYYLGTDLVLKS